MGGVNPDPEVPLGCGCAERRKLREQRRLEQQKAAAEAKQAAEKKK
jgi:hypothetical protein